jgi:hypothetical protein
VLLHCTTNAGDLQDGTVVQVEAQDAQATQTHPDQHVLVRLSVSVLQNTYLVWLAWLASLGDLWSEVERGTSWRIRARIIEPLDFRPKKQKKQNKKQDTDNNTPGASQPPTQSFRTQTKPDQSKPNSNCNMKFQPPNV